MTSKQKSGAKATKTGSNAAKKSAQSTASKSTASNSTAPKSRASTSNAAQTAQKTTTAPVENVRVETHERRGGNGISWVALLCGLGGLGLAGYTWYNGQATTIRNEAAMTRLNDFSSNTAEIRQGSEKLQSSLSDVKQEVAGFSNSIAAMDSRFEAVDSKISSVEENVAEQVAAIESNIAGLETSVGEQIESRSVALEENYGRIASALDAFGMKEVEQLVKLAQERLVLASDTPAALRALKVADAKLAAMDDSRALTLRQTIGNDIAALSKVEYPDVDTLATRLATSIKMIDEMPLKELGKLEAQHAPNEATGQADQPAATETVEDTSTANDSGNGGGQWWSSLSSIAEKTGAVASKAGGALADSLKGAVVVHDLEAGATPLMAPEQRYFLRENLKLAVQNSQYSLIKGYTSSAQAGAQSAQEMLARYFVAEDSSVSDLNALLDEVANINLEVEIPDITPTVDAVSQATAAE